MKNARVLGLLVVGGLLGCAAGAGVRASFAAPAAGSWSCYGHGLFPDVAAAQSHEDARAVTESMNKIAPHSPAGTVVTIPYRSSGQVCVKH